MATESDRPRFEAAQETITPQVRPTKNREELAALVARFLETAPVEAPMTEEEIMDEIKAYRAEKAAQNAQSSPNAV